MDRSGFGLGAGNLRGRGGKKYGKLEVYPRGMSGAAAEVGAVGHCPVFGRAAVCVCPHDIHHAQI